MGDPQYLLLAASAVLMVMLVAMSAVDFRRLRIPNEFNFALAFMGLGFQTATQPAGLPMQILFAAGALLAMWLVRRAHFVMTGRIGLGLGDVKMLGAAACWISPLMLPILLFIASASALLFVGGQVAMAGPAAARARVPFGPFIALGLGSSWMLEQFAGFNMGLL